jgi:hypothetical protein
VHFPGAAFLLASLLTLGSIAIVGLFARRAFVQGETARASSLEVAS